MRKSLSTTIIFLFAIVVIECAGALDAEKSLSKLLRAKMKIESNAMAEEDMYTALTRREKAIFLSAMHSAFDSADIIRYLSGEHNMLFAVHVLPVGLKNSFSREIKYYLDAYLGDILPIVVLDGESEYDSIESLGPSNPFTIHTDEDLHLTTSLYIDVASDESSQKLLRPLAVGFQSLYDKRSERGYRDPEKRKFSVPVISANPKTLSTPVVKELISKHLPSIEAAKPGLKLFLFSSVPEQRDGDRIIIEDIAYRNSAMKNSKLINPSLGEQCPICMSMANSSENFLWADIGAVPLFYGVKFEEEMNVLDWMKGRTQQDSSAAFSVVAEVRNLLNAVVSPPMASFPFVSPLDEKIEVVIHILHDYPSSPAAARIGLNSQRIQDIISAAALPGTRISVSVKEMNLGNCVECTFAVVQAMKTQTSYSEGDSGTFSLTSTPYIDGGELLSYLKQIGGSLHSAQAKAGNGRQFNVYVIDLDREDVLLIDKRHLFSYEEDAALVLRTRAGEVTFNYACGVISHSGRVIEESLVVHLSKETERFLIGALLGSLFGLSPPWKLLSHETGEVINNYIYSSMQGEPFGLFSPTLQRPEEMPLSISKIAWRNVILSHLAKNNKDIYDSLVYLDEKSIPLFHLLSKIDEEISSEALVRWGLYKLKIEHTLSALELDDFNAATYLTRSTRHEVAFFDLVFNYILKESTSYSLICASEFRSLTTSHILNWVYTYLVYFLVFILWVIGFYQVVDYYIHALKKEK